MAAGASRPVPLPLHVAVAVSGGIDSTALLHCCVTAAAELGVQVHALHVNHGLQARADDWQRHVAAQCRRWAARGLPVSFHAWRIESQPARGDSVEAWARHERYAALARMATEQSCSLVLLAQHRGDQAETVLLQALRGAGPAGLSAMPKSIERQGLVWARPWLDLPRQAIAAYAHRHRLSHVDDPSNAHTRFARNRLRHDVLPVLSAGFPDAEAALLSVARRAQEAAELQREIAEIDVLQVVVAGRLMVAPWRVLSPARRRNVLRTWLAQQVPDGAPETLADRLLFELPASRAGQWPLAGGELRLHAGGLALLPVHPVKGDAPVESRTMDISRPVTYEVPGWPGRLVVRRSKQGGVATTLLRDVCIRSRAAGDDFQFEPDAIPRSLKKQFQSRQVPRWCRDGPVLSCDGRIVFVAGLGVDARCRAPTGAEQRSIEWQAHAEAAAGAPGRRKTGV